MRLLRIACCSGRNSRIATWRSASATFMLPVGRSLRSRPELVFPPGSILCSEGTEKESRQCFAANSLSGFPIRNSSVFDDSAVLLGRVRSVTPSEPSRAECLDKYRPIPLIFCHICSICCYGR